MKNVCPNGMITCPNCGQSWPIECTDPLTLEDSGEDIVCDWCDTALRLTCRVSIDYFVEERRNP